MIIKLQSIPLTNGLLLQADMDYKIMIETLATKLCTKHPIVVELFLAYILYKKSCNLCIGEV